MANKKITNLEKKKKELEEELVRIQDGIDRSIDGVREGVVENLDPKSIIRRYPLPVVGGALLLGFLLAKPKSKSAGTGKDKDGVGSVIASELRKALTKKAVSTVLDIVDDQISSRQKRDAAD